MFYQKNRINPGSTTPVEVSFTALRLTRPHRFE